MLHEPIPILDGVPELEPPLHVETRIPVPAGALDARSCAVALNLRAALEPIVRRVAGNGVRPASLSRGLDIDRTLAARILRAVRSDDNVQLLHEVPAPHGLRIFLEAAARAGVEESLRDRAAESVREFERLIDEFPGGRSALDAALAAWDDGVRQRNERSAKQAIHKSMSSLLGYQADVMLATVMIQPSATGGMCDAAYVLGKYGVRRLRASAPITVFGRRSIVTETDATDNIRVETLDGAPAPDEADAYLLKDFCTRPCPSLGLCRLDSLFLYTLPEDQPAVNTPVTLVSAQVVRNSFLRYRTDTVRQQWESHIPRFPCKVLLADFFLHDDVFSSAAPFLTSTLHGLAVGPKRADEPSFQLDKVDLSAPIQSLGHGLSGAASRDVPRYTDMLSNVFRRTGWDADRFRGYRCRIQYPVPLVSLTFWFDLPPAP
jgi:hypothetical protein